MTMAAPPAGRPQDAVSGGAGAAPEPAAAYAAVTAAPPSVSAAPAPEAATEQELEMLSFLLGTEEYVVPVGQVQEVLTPREVRLEVWKRIATDLRPAQLDRICTKVVGFDELPAQFGDFIEGRVTGRTVVRIP